MEQSKFYQIKNITEHEYILVGCDGSIITRPIRDIDKTATAFTIQDAKDGDVLVNWNNTVFIFKAIEDETVKFHIAYNGEKWDAVKTPSTKLSHLGLPEPQFEFHPATKEQRELLFQKIREKGYEWDADRKELKKIEQKTAWSEEDEKILNCIITDYEGEIANLSDTPIDKQAESLYWQYISWLKSLRPQPKQEWSEEDSNMLQSILDEYKSMTKEKRDWLKSLRPPKKWKPSDAMLQSLQFVIEHHAFASPVNKDNIIKLYNGLKQL